MEKIEVKFDCFAYNKGRCVALKKIYCNKQNCSFYKTKEQEMEDRKKYKKYNQLGDIKENE